MKKTRTEWLFGVEPGRVDLNEVVRTAEDLAAPIPRGSYLANIRDFCPRTYKLLTAKCNLSNELSGWSWPVW